jgi:hypothetical protein
VPLTTDYVRRDEPVTGYYPHKFWNRAIVRTGGWGVEWGLHWGVASSLSSVDDDITTNYEKRPAPDTPFEPRPAVETPQQRRTPPDTEYTRR